MIRTLKEVVIWLRDWDLADEVRAAVEAWVVRYNEQRPHQAWVRLYRDEPRRERCRSLDQLQTGSLAWQRVGNVAVGVA